MKAHKLLLVATVLVVGMLSCTRNVYINKRVPPGHAKKAAGHKSAKHHAPGHQKKYK